MNYPCDNWCWKNGCVVRCVGRYSHEDECADAAGDTFAPLSYDGSAPLTTADLCEGLMTASWSGGFVHAVSLQGYPSDNNSQRKILDGLARFQGIDVKFPDVAEPLHFRRKST